MWYVLQVPTGKEQQVIDQLDAKIQDVWVGECFSPRYTVQKHLAGEWKSVQQRMFPGYVIVELKAPDSFALQLRKLDCFARLLSSDAGYVPLAPQEKEWICSCTKQGARVVDESEGIIEGDKVKVLSGPLVGQEALIKKVNRRKRLAFLEMSICGRSVQVKLGLSIVKRVESSEMDS